MINNIIEKTKVEYAIPVYDLDAIQTILNSELQFSIAEQLFLETLRMNISVNTSSYLLYLKKE